MKSSLSADRFRLVAGAVRESWQPPRSELVVSALFLTTIVSLITVDVRRHASAPFDQTAIDAIQQLDAPYLSQSVDLVNAVTSSFWAPLIWGVVLLAMLAVRWFLPALVLALMPAGGLLNNLIGVHLVVRTRPDADEVVRTIGEWNAPSYPSGHVMGAVMLYGFLIYLSPRIANGLARWVVVVMSVLILATVGFARLWAGAHWPSDVVAAYVLGALVVVLLIMTLSQVERTALHLRQRRLFPEWLTLVPINHDPANANRRAR